MLTETYHSFKLIPTDGRKHRDDVPPSFRGDSVGRWEGDTLVVDTTNFTDTNWMAAEGNVSFHSDALHIVERYRRVDANTLEVDATVEDPKVLTGPWKVPTQTLRLAPFDQIMEVGCTGTESEGPANRTVPSRNTGRSEVGPLSRQRRCIHSHSSGWRRTYISRTSVQRCVNSRTASGVSARGGSTGMLVDQAVAAAAERQREHRHDRRAGAQRQRRHGRGRRRRALEEVDVDRRPARGCADRSAAPRRRRLQHPHHAPDRALAVDDRVAGALADPLEQLVEARVVERARQHANRLEAERCAIACSSQKPKCPVKNSTPFPCA